MLFLEGIANLLNDLLVGDVCCWLTVWPPEFAQDRFDVAHLPAFFSGGAGRSAWLDRLRRNVRHDRIQPVEVGTCRKEPQAGVGRLIGHILAACLAEPAMRRPGVSPEPVRGVADETVARIAEGRMPLDIASGRSRRNIGTRRR